MKNFLLSLMLVLGITFIYNPQTNGGFVYYNGDTFNTVIIVDNSKNQLVYFKAIPYRSEPLTQGFDAWLQDKVQKGLPFSGMIIPFGQQQPDLKQQQQNPTEKRYGK